MGDSVLAGLHRQAVAGHQERIAAFTAESGKAALWVAVSEGAA